MFDRLPTWLRQHVAALRALVAFTVIFGIGYPLLITAIAQIPGLQHRADGSLIHLDGKVVGSAVIGQAVTDAKGNPIPKYFQSRPSAGGYDPTASGASNLGPEQIIDTLPNPAVKGDTGTDGLLTEVCARSEAVGQLEGVNGRRRAVSDPLAWVDRTGGQGRQRQPGVPGDTIHPVVRRRRRQLRDVRRELPDREDRAGPRTGQGVAAKPGAAGRCHSERLGS
jgi:hypothetical protein